MSCLVIAEAGVNHNGEVQRAFALVDAAVAAGADIIKFQTFRSGDLLSRHARLAKYQAEAGVEGTQLDMVRKLELSPHDFSLIRERAESKGIEFMSTPFDLPSLALLCGEMSLGSVKISSGDLTNGELLAAAGRVATTIYLSTGMGTLAEVEEAIEWCRQDGDPAILLLHCLSAYPAPAGEMNLRAMDTLRSAFGLPVGLSDHTLGLAIPWAAVAMGAEVVEKHLTMDKTLSGPDHAASLEPDVFRALVDGIRDIERARGDGVKRPMPSEHDTRLVARRSWVALKDIAVGHVVRREDLALKRPGTGIPFKDVHTILGRTTLRRLEADEIITPDALA